MREALELLHLVVGETVIGDSAPAAGDTAQLEQAVQCGIATAGKASHVLLQGDLDFPVNAQGLGHVPGLDGGPVVLGDYVQPFLERHRELYGQVPRQSAWDGGFASAANLSWAKEQGVEDVAFAKKCGVTVESMVRSSRVYKELKRFRAGIEGCIGTLKHTFGLHRCSWKGWPHFQSYVHASVLTYNLVLLARLLS